MSELMISGVGADGEPMTEDAVLYEGESLRDVLLVAKAKQAAAIRPSGEE